MEITQIELIWLVVGITFILIEFTTIPGIGFLFLGLGALTTSVLVYYFPVTGYYQLVSAGISSLAWFLLLWYPLKKFVYGTKGSDDNYFDIVGMQVEVITKDIKPSESGKVYWSGTYMNAKLDKRDHKTAKIGDKLYVSKVKGNVLICSHKKLT